LNHAKKKESEAKGEAKNKIFHTKAQSSQRNIWLCFADFAPLREN